MPALIERHKMSLAMWSALKSHIMKQREKKKQGYTFYCFALFSSIIYIYIYGINDFLFNFFNQRTSSSCLLSDNLRIVYCQTTI